MRLTGHKSNEMDYECLNQCFSTTRRVTRTVPAIVAGNHVKYRLRLEPVEGRQAEGGLRTRGFYKHGAMMSEMDKPLITVITPVLNGSKYLEGCILSVTGQTYDHVEYILIDGGSTDGSLDIIKKYEYAIDYWVSEPDRGIYDAMNKGISLSSGDWICVLGADDYFIGNDVIAQMAGHLAECDSAVKLAYGSVAMIDGDEILCVIGDAWSKAKEKLGKVMSVPYPGLMHRRAWFERYDLYDTSYRIVSDYEMLLRGWPHEEAVHVPGLLMVGMRTGGVSNASKHAFNSLREIWRAQKTHGIEVPPFRKLLAFVRILVRFILQQVLTESVIWRLHNMRSLGRPILGESTAVNNAMRWQECRTPEQWDHNLASLGGHPLQSTLWGNARHKVDGISQLLLEYRTENGEVAGLARIEVRTVSFLVKIAWVPKGPVLPHDEAGIAEASLRAELKRRGFIACITDWYAISKKPHPRGQSTIWLDLSCGVDALLKGLDSRMRYGVRRALREGVIIHTTAKPTEVSTFFHLCNALSVSKGFSLPGSEALMLELIRSSLPDGEVGMSLYIGEVGGEIASGVVVAKSGQHLHYFWGASDRRFSQYRVSEAIQWQVIQDGVASGMERYDLEGIDPVGNPGVYQFKQKMGGTEVALQGMEVSPLSWVGRVAVGAGRRLGRL